MRRRVAATMAGLALAVAGFAPAAQAVYHKPKTEPPSCDTLIGNVVYGDPACEGTEMMP